MVAPAMHPAGEPRLATRIRPPQLAAGLGAVWARVGAGRGRLGVRGGHGPGMVSSRERVAGMLLIRRRRPIGEPPTLHPVGRAGVATLEGSAGAGRIALAMTEAGIPCADLVQAVIPADIALAALRGLDLGQRFD